MLCDQWLYNSVVIVSSRSVLILGPKSQQNQMSFLILFFEGQQKKFEGRDEKIGLVEELETGNFFPPRVCKWHWLLQCWYWRVYQGAQAQGNNHIMWSSVFVLRSPIYCWLYFVDECLCSLCLFFLGVVLVTIDFCLLPTDCIQLAVPTVQPESASEDIHRRANADRFNVWGVCWLQLVWKRGKDLFFTLW